MAESINTDFTGYAKLLEHVVIDAFRVCGKADFDAIKRVLEFATREHNPILQAFCAVYEYDEQFIRNRLEESALEGLKQ